MKRCDFNIANIVDNHSTDRSLLAHTANEINADGHHSRRQAFHEPWEKKSWISYISNIVDCLLWETCRTRGRLCDSGFVDNHSMRSFSDAQTFSRWTTTTFTH